MVNQRVPRTITQRVQILKRKDQHAQLAHAERRDPLFSKKCYINRAGNEIGEYA